MRLEQLLALNKIDQNKIPVLVLLAMLSTVDTIDHNTISNRSKRPFGIAGKPLAWMSSYHSDRYQTVCIDGEVSKSVLMKYSVPQGTVLGVQNCIMYINPVGEACRTHCLKHNVYADINYLLNQHTWIPMLRHFVVLRPVILCLGCTVTW